MKKILFAAIVLALIFSCSCVALAADVSCDVPELDLSINIPADWVVFDRDVDPSDPNLAIAGLDEQTIEHFMIEKNIYLDAIFYGEKASELKVMTLPGSAVGTDINNLKQFYAQTPIEAKTLFLSSFDTTSRDDTYDYDSLQYYEQPQALFLTVEETTIDNGTPIGCIRYMTIVNGQMLLFDYISYSGSISNADRDSMKKMIDTVQFTNIQSMPDDLLIDDSISQTLAVSAAHDIAYFLGAAILPAIIIIVIIAAIIIIIAIYKSNKKKKQAKQIAYTGNASLSGSNNLSNPAAPHQAENKQEKNDVYNTIEKLYTLKEQGALTNEEFEAKKHELLKKL